MQKNHHPALLGAFIVLFACNKSSHSDPNAVNIYLGGRIGDNSVYWKNGKLSYLQASLFGNPTQIALHGNDVYSVGPGSYFPGDSLMYWINGNRFHLASFDAFRGYLNGIATSNGSVYFVGNCVTNNNIVVVWKNGIPSILNEPHVFSYASGIAVSGNDIYISGSVGDTYAYGTYWKNGQSTLLSDSMHTAVTTSILVSGTDVYVTGYEYDQAGKYSALYWKNGNPIVLADTTSPAAIAYGIAMAGMDVYVSGCVGNTICYWKNGARTNLSAHADDNSIPVGIAYYNGDVYVCGTIYDPQISSEIIGGYWKNNKFVAFTDPTFPVLVNSILVTGE